MSQYDLFLCYYSGDAPLAERLKRALNMAGVSVWFDGMEIQFGDSIVSKMQEGIERSRHALILFTPGFLSGDAGIRWDEVETYLLKRVDGRTRVLPLAAGVDHSEYWQKLPLLRNARSEKIEVNQSAGASDAELTRVARTISEVMTLRTNVQMVGRDDLNAVIGGFEDRLSDVRQHLMVSGNDCAGLFPSKSAFVRRALDRRVRIEIMCVDPGIKSAVEHLVKVDPRFDRESHFKSSMQGVEAELRLFRAEYPGLFAFRYMPVVPAVGLYISDPGLPASITKVEMYTPKPWKPVETRAHIVVRSDSVWAEYFLNSWRSYWEMSRVPA